MKYLWIGAALLALCMVVCTVSTAVLDRDTAWAVCRLEDARQQADAGHLSSACTLVMEAQEFWQSRRGYWGVFLRHSETDEINAVFQQLAAYAQAGCAEEFSPTCAGLIARIRHLADMEKPRYYNVLTCGGI